MVSMKKHVYSILAEREEKKEPLKPPTQINRLIEKSKTLKHTQYNNKNRNIRQHINRNRNREAGPWVPSLENRGGRLKSLLWAQLSLHTQCPNLPQRINRQRLYTTNGTYRIKSTASRKIESLKGLIDS